MSHVRLDDCVICERTIDGDSAAIGLWDDPRGGRATWVPFVEDLRTSGFRLVHPVCYATQHGVEALVDVFHEYDRKTRKETWDLIDKVDEVRKPG